MKTACCKAFIAEVSGAQVLATNPIQLIVAKETALQLNVSRLETGTVHTISGRLLYGGEGVANRTLAATSRIRRIRSFLKKAFE